MAILSRRRQPPFTETLPDGSTVYEALRRLTRGDSESQPLDRPPLDRMAGVGSSAPETVTPTIAPRTIEPPLTRLAPDNTLPTPAVPDLSATDYYQSNHAIRPHIDPAISDPQQQLTRYESDVRNYQPQKEGAGKLIARTALGFIGGGIPGAAYTVGNELLDRRQHDKAWQQNELGRTDQQLATIGARRREGMQEQLMQSQIGENQAQAIKAAREPDTPPLVRYGDYTISPSEAARLTQEKELATREKPKSARPPIKQSDENGNEYLADADTGEPLRDTQGNIRYSARAKPERPAETPKDYATRQRNFTAAQSKYRGLIEEEKAAARAKDAAYTAYSTARAKYDASVADREPDVIAAKAAADRAQSRYESFWGKKDAAKAEMLQHGDGVGADGEPLPPKAVSRGDRSGQYSGQRISRAKLPEAARRLKMTAAQAEAYLKQQGAEIY